MMGDIHAQLSSLPPSRISRCPMKTAKIVSDSRSDVSRNVFVSCFFVLCFVSFPSFAIIFIGKRELVSLFCFSLV